ncbi:MAG: hypothetical protein H6925_04810 [Holosporaceae bacterium]|nr:MAG: hypothetical protein H6925_04810 [Holosporaceae bacterium]
MAEQLSKPSDGRAISITLGSKDIFDRMGLWEALAPMPNPSPTCIRLMAGCGRQH